MTARTQTFGCSTDVRRALLALLKADEKLRRSFFRSCQAVIFSTRDIERVHKALTTFDDFSYEHVEDAMYDFALRVFPASWAAGHERLRKRIASQGLEPCSEVEKIERVLEDSSWLMRWLASSSLSRAYGDDYMELLTVTRFIFRAGRSAGYALEPRNLSDRIWNVRCDLFPNAPGARWDEEWADDIRSQALAFVSSRCRGTGYDPDHSRVRAEAEWMDASAIACDRVEFRLAARTWATKLLKGQADTPVSSASPSHTA